MCSRLLYLFICLLSGYVFYRLGRWHGSSVPALRHSVTHDNIGGGDYQRVLNYPPIDVVYTWVNGSDPRWLQKKLEWVSTISTTLHAYREIECMYLCFNIGFASGKGEYQ